MKKMFKGKSILITGGTGFLGRALTKEILKYKPHSIRIFSRDEVKHHKIQEMFKDYTDKSGEPIIRNFIGDVRDYSRVLRATKGVDIVIHAAALKRIDMIEYNVEEAIQTNINGSLNVIKACLENNVEKAIFISTDKACCPVNSYGACKFVSERIFTESNYSKGKARTVFSCVRYGNVLESTGSVIPFFMEKIRNKETIPLTDERMTRFIITSKRAVNLIFQAIAYGVGGEVFVPRLPAIKITDLIEVLKEKFNSESKIKKVGIRPGEKIHELMVNKSEVSRTYSFDNVYVITSSIEEYQQKISPAIYAKKGRKINESLMQEYKSDTSILDKLELRKIIDSLNL